MSVFYRLQYVCSLPLLELWWYFLNVSLGLLHCPSPGSQPPAQPRRTSLGSATIIVLFRVSQFGYIGTQLQFIFRFRWLRLNRILHLHLFVMLWAFGSLFPLASSEVKPMISRHPQIAFLEAEDRVVRPANCVRCGLPGRLEALVMEP